ncbi:MAG: GntR family transcriptional regulator [Ramlibacter sp.]|nr:GntR family transcriptional regulator [Ramlibacter sp.]
MLESANSPSGFVPAPETPVRKLALRPVNARQDLVAQVVEQFKENLISGDLQPGDRIPPEPVLCSQLGVSRTAVREAIKTLSAVGLVEIRRGNGTYIATGNMEAPVELLALSLVLAKTTKARLIELRQVFEYAGGELVVKNATEQDFAAIEAQVERFAQAVHAHEPAAVLRKLDQEFHDMLFDATHNPMFARLARAAMAAFASTMQHALASADVDAIALQDHREMLDALRRRSVADYLVLVKRSLATWMDHLDTEPN